MKKILLIILLAVTANADLEILEFKTVGAANAYTCTYTCVAKEDQTDNDGCPVGQDLLCRDFNPEHCYCATVLKP